MLSRRSTRSKERFTLVFQSATRLFALLATALATSLFAPPPLAALAPNAVAEAKGSQAGFEGLKWRSIGPFRGGRALAVTGVSGEPNLFYFGAAAGGVWKTIDAGATWTPIFDAQSISSIGAIAVAPSDHRILYVGTGEGALRGNITFGNGVYRSGDGGKTWTHVGLEDTRQIGALVVNPANPDIVLVAAIGHAFGPNRQRGLFRTTDGGKTWSNVLYKDADTGAIDVTLDPVDPKIVYAAMWQVRRQPWSFSSGGAGSGLYRSTDGGATWSQLSGHGLPGGILGRIDVSVSAADHRRIYAMVEAADGGLYRSDDAGGSWHLVSGDGRIRQRAWYFSKTYADPKNADTVYVLNTGMLRSTDGGKTFALVPATHGDHHGLWIDPAEPRRMINANDGGASISLDGGQTWSSQANQPTAQFYHVSVDNRFPYWVYGAQQDNSNLAVASFDDEGIIGPRSWYPAGGGESGFVIPDPRNADIIYSGQENQVQRFNRRAQQAQDISPWPVDTSGHPAGELEHRFNWTSPLMLSPHNPDVLYSASEAVWKSVDHGNSWAKISGDLTRNDKSKQTASGGPLTKDITSVEYYDTIFALAESPLKAGMLWAGTDDGLVKLTSDGGTHWTDVTPRQLPKWGTVDMIDPSPHDAAGAYLAVDRHKLDDIHPYAWRTADAGKSWIAIAAGLPEGAVVHAVREDPVRRGLLYAATELGVFVSFDDGAHWRSLQGNLPPTPIHDLVVKGDDLVVATHGRAFWVLDNVTPLRQADAAARDTVFLYTPAKALRLHYPTDVDSRHPVGENPPAGALIDYQLRTVLTGELTVDILDANGRRMRHLSSTKTDKAEQPPEWPDRIVQSDLIPTKAGLNRLVWDLRMDDPAQIPGAFYSGLAPRGPVVAPGRYQVRLTVGGETRTAPLDVVADPRTAGNDAAIAAKTQLAVAVVQDIDALHRAVNDVRAARKAISAHPAGTDTVARDGQLASIEQTLMQVNMKGSEANLSFPGMLNEQYATFQATLDDADTAPTRQHLEMYRTLHAELQVQLDRWKALATAPVATAERSERAKSVTAPTS